MSRCVRLAPAALLVLCACVSTPAIRYYTFDMTPSGSDRPGVDVVVGPFRTADAVSRRQLMIQTSPVEVEYYAVDQWAGDLGELVARKLAVELGSAPAGGRRLELAGTVVECGQVDLPGGGAAARLELAVELRDAGEGTQRPLLLSRSYRCEQRADRPAPAAVAEALSGCLETVAASIASDAAAL